MRRDDILDAIVISVLIAIVAIAEYLSVDAPVPLVKTCALNSPSEPGWKPVEEVRRMVISELVANKQAVMVEREGAVICTYLNADGLIVTETSPIHLWYWQAINRRTAHAQRNDADDRSDAI